MRRLQVLATLTSMVAGLLLALPAPPTVAAEVDDRPNFLLIVADDMNASDLRYMPATRRLLGERGATFKDFLSNHPLCCPARAEILTGKLAQNNGVLHNEPPYGGFGAYMESGSAQDNIAVWLESAGYSTAFVGKYVNHYYEREYFPGKPAGWQPGWTIFNPFSKFAYKPYDFRSLTDGLVSGVHTSDYVGQKTVDYIEQFSAQDKPFFVYASQLAPHGMRVDGRWVSPVPPPRHRDLYPNAKPPAVRKESFNRRTYVSRDNSPFTRADMIQRHRARIQSLRAVDEANARAVRKLRELGELDNTYILFTSDNGHLIGEHRYFGKNVPYREALEIPLLMRGPGIASGSVERGTGSLIDLAPTLLDLARVPGRARLDGRSLWAQINDRGLRSRYTLIQGGTDDPSRRWGWRGVRTKRFTYVKYVGGPLHLFDRRNDPHEITNVARRARYAKVRRTLRLKLSDLRVCEAGTCRRAGAR